MACLRTSPMRTGSCANTKSSSKERLSLDVAPDVQPRRRVSQSLIAGEVHIDAVSDNVHAVHVAHRRRVSVAGRAISSAQEYDFPEQRWGGPCRKILEFAQTGKGQLPRTKECVRSSFHRHPVRGREACRGASTTLEPNQSDTGWALLCFAHLESYHYLWLPGRFTLL